MSDLAKILPPEEWLTREQRRLWLCRTAAYLAAGLPRRAAEQEAMAELVMTGKLCRHNATEADSMENGNGILEISPSGGTLSPCRRNE
jgi:hypothetical protein